jgi:Rieske Fe-S protein
MKSISRRSAVGMFAPGFVAFLFAPAASVGAVATPQIRAGDVCKKIGRRQTVGNKTFECVKTANGAKWKRAKATPPPPTTSEVKVLDSSALAVGVSQNVVVTSGGRNIGAVVTRTAAGVVAFSRTCTHAGAFVSPGASGRLTCSAHGSVFNASTGAVIEGPAEIALTQYKASERSGAIYITLSQDEYAG